MAILHKSISLKAHFRVSQQQRNGVDDSVGAGVEREPSEEQQVGITVELVQKEIDKGCKNGTPSKVALSRGKSVAQLTCTSRQCDGG